MDSGMTKNQIIEQLTKSPHGDLTQFVPIGGRAAREEPEFVAHLIAWNRGHGQIRDSKVALPVLSLSAVRSGPEDPVDKDEIGANALAHLATLSPRDLTRALEFARVAIRPEAKLTTIKIPGPGRALNRMVARYLRTFEADPPRWDRVALQHRGTLKGLYARYHVKPGPRADAVLFKGERPQGSVFEAVAGLKDMSAREAAGTILQKRIPFLIAMGAAGSKIKDPDVVLALINQMSPTELVTNTKLLVKLGMRQNPALRGAYETALRKVPAGKAATLKTSKAAEAVEDDEGLAARLGAVQEKQIDALGGIDGNWLLLGDRSPSMRPAIAFTVELAATLARFVKGKVHVVFFDGAFYKYLDATGMELEKIKWETRLIDAGGNATSVGSALQYAIDKGLEFDAVAVVSDGGENTPPYLHATYPRIEQKFGKQVPIYLYLMGGESTDVLAHNMRLAGHDLSVIDLRAGFDYYSLPNIVKTMKTQRHGLIEQIMDTPLLKLDDVLIADQKEV